MLRALNREPRLNTHESLRIIRDEHAALAAMLRSLRMMAERGPRDDSAAFFDVVRAMLFYIDAFPERLHHPKESDLLFPRIAKQLPDLMPVISRLERDHLYGEDAVRRLQHMLLGWELMGEPRRAAFMEELTRYIEFYLEHMRIEEQEILPNAERALTEAEWEVLDRAFAANRDPLSGYVASGGQVDPAYERLFTRIVMRAPAPIGLGEG